MNLAADIAPPGNEVAVAWAVIWFFALADAFGIGMLIGAYA